MGNFAEVLAEPIVPFAVLLLVILTVPILFERLKLPGLIGLLVAGVLLGPYGLKILSTELPMMKLLSDIGLLYLMFVAGLEVDIKQFKRRKDRSMGFGFLTFAIPLSAGILVGRLFGWDWNASILIGSLLASHTLLAYPIISKLGVVNNEAVIVTIGATIFTDIGSLLVLAVCIAVHAGDFSIANMAALILALAIYTAVVLFGFDWLGRLFFNKIGKEEGNQFLFVLLVVFLASLGAQLIGVEKIIGAFLAGLAVNEVVGEGAVKEKVVFVGSVLFIPIFFVDLGLLIDLQGFLKSILSFAFPATIVFALLGSKFLAAFFSKLLYKYTNQELLTMWSLSIPQVGATLAAALVGYKAQLINEEVLNSVIVLLLVTATLGPIITSRVAVGLPLSSAEPHIEPDFEVGETLPLAQTFTVVVPVYNPSTERNLIEMAALFAKGHSGQIIPLAITVPHGGNMDVPELETALKKGELLLEKAKELATTLQVSCQSLLRIDDSISQGIVRAAREQKANLIVMGWGRRRGFQARLFGNLIDGVLWDTHCPVAVSRLLIEPQQIQRVLVPVENLGEETVRLLKFAEALGNSGLSITILHLCDRSTSDKGMIWIQSQLAKLTEEKTATNAARIEIEVRRGHDIVRQILTASESADLVVLRATRYRTAAGLAVSDITNQLLDRLTCSVVMLGEPPHIREFY
ncbi:cation:proton antiporter [Planktothrix sp. FACHB-1365]|uniref:cation:proton antiporter domain-containing protein n=1 Tax=Planktothrix sp. FACHB-1365 TaxID=2692855 RepID=UPI001685AABF|nr:cation:proton antiporter [Planktothrix sp. FACHB-1365]MBD2480656.1 cation:proton antiporter [Planktothrix sp. FACHB-1365]